MIFLLKSRWIINFCSHHLSYWYFICNYKIYLNLVSLNGIIEFKCVVDLLTWIITGSNNNHLEIFIVTVVHLTRLYIVYMLMWHCISLEHFVRYLIFIFCIMIFVMLFSVHTLELVFCYYYFLFTFLQWNFTQDLKSYHSWNLCTRDFCVLSHLLFWSANFFVKGIFSLLSLIFTEQNHLIITSVPFFCIIWWAFTLLSSQ